jgi:outer membrane receptor protein involved in Fe transport
VGGKFTFADGSADLNVAIFRSEFEDMQTSQFDGSLTFNVTNAGEAVVQGVEVDGRWALIDNLLLRGGVAFIDFNTPTSPIHSAILARWIISRPQAMASVMQPDNAANSPPKSRAMQALITPSTSATA